jgi:hypothetical protein
VNEYDLSEEECASWPQPQLPWYKARFVVENGASQNEEPIYVSSFFWPKRKQTHHGVLYREPFAARNKLRKATMVDTDMVKSTDRKTQVYRE